MRFFTETDLFHAIEVMITHDDLWDMQLLGTMSGIKRRARSRALVAFAKQLSPPPPDQSITTIRALLGALFGKSISNNELHRHFATPGRKANDRVDMAQFDEWLDGQKEHLQSEAALLLADLDAEWGTFTTLAARKAGKLRRE